MSTRTVTASTAALAALTASLAARPAALAEPHYLRARFGFDSQAGEIWCPADPAAPDGEWRPIAIAAAVTAMPSLFFELGDAGPTEPFCVQHSDWDAELCLGEVTLYPEARLAAHFNETHTITRLDGGKQAVLSINMSFTAEQIAVRRTGHSEVRRDVERGYYFADPADLVLSVEMTGRSLSGNLLTVTEVGGAVVYKDAGVIEQDASVACICPIEIALHRAMFADWDADRDSLPDGGASFVGRTDGPPLGAPADFLPAQLALCAALGA